MGTINNEERETVGAFVNTIFDRFLGGELDDYTAKVAIQKVIVDAVLESRAQAFEYMRAVIEGKGD
jgi:hypothetical protein